MSRFIAFQSESAQMIDYYWAGKRVHVSHGRRQAKAGRTEEFKKQFQENVSRWVFRRLTKVEMDAYKGPMNYCTSPWLRHARMVHLQGHPPGYGAAAA